MLISWLQKTTLIDYPDKIACIVFTAWCNLRCRFCHNPELVLPEKIQQSSSITETEFFQFLQTRKHILDGVVISWWEPTLHRDLFAFCYQVKELWLLVKLDTNGRDPIMVKKMLDEKLIDYVAMDIKINDAQRLSLLQKKEKTHPYRQSIKLIMDSEINYEFRTTLIKPFHTPETFILMLNMIQWAKQYYLQTYRSQKTLDPDFNWHPFTEQEMQSFQAIACEYVHHCSIR